MLTATTLPVAPNDEEIYPVTANPSGVQVTSATSLQVNWSAPSNSAALYDTYQFWGACGTNAAQDVLALQANPATFGTGSATTSSALYVADPNVGSRTSGSTPAGALLP